MSAVDIEGKRGDRPSPVARLLDARTWGHQTKTFDALGFTFAVRTADPALGAYLDAAYASLAQDGDPDHLYSIVEREPRERRGFSVFLDGRRTDSLDTAAQTLRYLTWHINREVTHHAELAGELLVFHASAVARDGRAAMFVAPMNSGKSTIATALVRGGLDYVTDEAVAFDERGVMVPYPRPVALERGSWSLFPDLGPRSAPGIERYLGQQWLVPPGALRPAAVAGPGRAALVVKLRYDAGATTLVRPMRRAHMVPHLVEQSFTFHRLGRSALTRVAEILAGATCVELTMNDLDEACTAVLACLDDGATGHD